MEGSTAQEQFDSYKKSLGIKNREFMITRSHEHLLEVSDVHYDSHEIRHRRILRIRLRANVAMPGCAPRTVTWGFAMVNVRTGVSELLLDNRIFVWTGHEVEVGEKRIRKVRLPKGVQLTAKAIEFLKDACAHEDGEQRISNYGGWLKDDNLTLFKLAYLRLRNKGTYSEHELQQAALRETPFGRARIKAGITEFKINVLEYDQALKLPSAVCIESAYIPGEENYSA